MIGLNKSILQLQQRYQSVQEKVQAELLIYSLIIVISKYNLSAGSSYIKLPKELHHPRKGLINIQNTDANDCFKQCFVRYLNITDFHPARITTSDKDFPKRLDFKNTKFPLKPIGIHKFEEK